MLALIELWLRFFKGMVNPNQKGHILEYLDDEFHTLKSGMFYPEFLKIF